MQKSWITACFKWSACFAISGLLATCTSEKLCDVHHQGCLSSGLWCLYLSLRAAQTCQDWNIHANLARIGQKDRQNCHRFSHFAMSSISDTLSSSSKPQLHCTFGQLWEPACDPCSHNKKNWANVCWLHLELQKPLEQIWGCRALGYYYCNINVGSAPETKMPLHCNLPLLHPAFPRSLMHRAKQWTL